MTSAAAVVLQAFLVSAVSLGFVDSSGALICRVNPGSTDAPASDLGRHHSACCLLDCSAASFVAIPGASGSLLFPLRRVSSRAILKAAANIRSPLKYYFAARGPPHVI
ncbi:MAG TPA: hypothetical protein VEK34_15000 [Methylocella sp.]|nr:hypothetical protein [Methylocella sp.]